ncbi:MAG TPA: signal peptidase I, partial [Tepidisphaeraceae bacterium]|nr:signal peptidase I [Tepidisphaeraceae bacterium]
ANAVETFRIPPPPRDLPEDLAKQISAHGKGAMAPTLEWNDRFTVHKYLSWTRWSIVVYHPPNDDAAYPSRIVGLPGEQVEIIDSVVRINGTPMPSPINAKYESNRFQTASAGRPITLGPDEYFILSDNSPIALDSRTWLHPAAGHQVGALPKSNIVGVVTYIYWPPSRWRRFK